MGARGRDAPHTHNIKGAEGLRKGGLAEPAIRVLAVTYVAPRHSPHKDTTIVDSSDGWNCGKMSQLTLVESSQ